MLPIRIQVRSIPGGWRLSVGRDGLRAASVDLAATAVDTLNHRIQTLLRPPVVAHSDVQRTEAEESAGSLLLDTLFSDPSVGRVLHNLLGEAHGAGQLALLVVDVEDPRLSGLPWELLGSGEPFEAAGGVVVARLAPGRPSQPACGPTAVHVHDLDPRDPLCARRTTELAAWFTAAGAPLQPDAPILHLVAHGDRSARSTWLTSEAGATSPGSAAHLLGPELARAALVVLDVCDAAALEIAEHAVVAARFTAQGAGAVIAPRTRLDQAAASAFSKALYGSLFAGDPLAEAVATGRRAVRRCALPHPDGRWCNPILLLSDVQAAQIRLPLAVWQPRGWALRDPEVRAWLQSAREAAGPYGFVGLEHLLHTCPTVGNAPWLAQLRYLLSQTAPILTNLRLLHRNEALQPCWDGTPRLLQHVPDPELDLGAFTRWLCEQLDGAVSALLGGARLQLLDPMGTGTTLEVDAFERSGVPAEGVEVLGGPEAGRWFEAGAIVGRAAGSDQGLYQDTPLVDPYLPRRALVLGEPFTLRKPAQLQRGDGRQTLPAGRIELERDDRLWLSRSTCLRAR